MTATAGDKQRRRNPERGPCGWSPHADEPTNEERKVNIPTNSDDIIDSRDVIQAVEELKAERRCQECDGEGVVIDPERTAYCTACDGSGLNPDFDQAEELAALEGLEAEGSNATCDWQYGETLIRFSYFQEYAKEFAGDIGAVNRDATWPMSHIDWEAAAEELQQDYSSIDFDGVEYWVR